MNGGRSDASTSTDDVKSRPLCLFYFTHPFGVLSPEPPTLATAPPHIARAFVNMQPAPAPPWSVWSPAPPTTSDDDYNTSSSASRPSYELGNATVHRTPVNLVSVTRTRNCTLDFSAARDSISSSLFSSDMWFNSSSSCKSTEYPRRLIPYNKILPPLQLPSPKDSSNLSSSDDFWPKKCLNPEKFSLPPIELPSTSLKVKVVRTTKCSLSSEEMSSVDGVALRPARSRRRLGVTKQRRARPADLRRLLTTLMRRALAGGAERNVSPALREALHTIREAWAEPRSLFSRSRTVHRSCVVCERAPPPPAARAPALMERAAAELPPRAGASPGLLRRRYSVPETIMRKYRLAQQRSESEESAPPTTRSAASASPPRDACCSPNETPHRFARRDRELMRKSALMRRMWGRPCGPCGPCEPCRSCCCCGGRETRSLDGSRSELRQLSSAHTYAAGWATPKRQRLDSSRDFRASDEMLRAAMRNSYDRAEELRHDRAGREDFSDSTYRSHVNEASPYMETMTDAFTDSDGSKFEVGHDRCEYAQYSEKRSSDTATIEMKSITVDEAHATSEHSAPSAGSDARSLSASSAVVSVSCPSPKASSTASCPSPKASSTASCPSSKASSTALCPSSKASSTAARPTPRDQLTTSAHIDGRISEHSTNVHQDDNDAFPYDKPLTIHTPSYEVLEIVVSETVNVNSVPSISTQPQDKTPHGLKAPTLSHKGLQNINIDEYVSNILVESLNSLTDQLECMNASMGNDRKISIVEKEIKVKLQNTGVNTIVHLSPTSNNQIIFGNEELCNNEEQKDPCNNPHEPLTIRDEPHSVESNNNRTSAGSPCPQPRCPCDSFDLQHDNVNQAVLQQIQKLFQDELHSFDPSMDYSKTMPEISHIEISNVTDVFIDNEGEPTIATSESAQAQARGAAEYEFISGVGAGNYYPHLDDNPVVPRFSAFPHTDSMEVNTSSSDDADVMGSDCTSLVDSLDDPNSPRSVLLRRGFNNRRSELVRSAIDVLDLLPENACNEEITTPKDKGESFFIKIKDNECDCDKENINVADRMPEKIKQRLYRRHHKREMRMECARRSRGKQRLRDVDRRHDEYCRGRRQLERECAAIVNALIDDVIAKLAQEEYKCMRIKHRPSRMVPSKSDENVAKRSWKKDLEPIPDKDPYKSLKNNSSRYDSNNSGKQKSERHQIHGKLSLLTRPSLAVDDRAAKRIYQKSEIHDGNKCIEILEILEYVNGSQSSPETTNSDENPNHSMKNKKSRIPIPISERLQRSPNDSHKSSSRRSSLPRATERNGNTSSGFADMLLQALGEPPPVSPPASPSAPPAPRRASVPHEPRSRSNSLRFKQMFDIIPEERSSLSLDSGNEDLNQNRRASAPDIADQYRESTDAECNDVPPAPALSSPQNALKPPVGTPRRNKDMKSAGTSPMNDSESDKHALKSKNQTTMTSPGSKSAATSPLRATVAESAARAGPEAGGRLRAGPEAGGRLRAAPRGRAWPGAARPDARAARDAGYKETAECDKVRPHRAATTQCERTAEVRRGTHRAARADRAPPPRPPRPPRPRSPCVPAIDEPSDRSPDDIAHYRTGKRNSRAFSLERSDDDEGHASGVKLPEFKGGESGGVSSSDSSESGGSLLCSLAPKWLSQGRARRAARRRDHERAAPPAADVPPAPDLAPPEPQPPGGWSVTVAGSCRAALPADVEMRLRFPHERDPDVPCQECTCRHCATCACSARGAARGRARGGAGGAPPLPPAAPPLPAAHAHARLARTDSSKLTLTMKKEALDSSILASKSSKKSGEPLPDVETYRASRSKLKSSVKTRRGYSLHCWLPENEAVPIRSNGLSVLGSAIIPELKPRVPTMSERDLTREYTPRHYLRS